MKNNKKILLIITFVLLLAFIIGGLINPVVIREYEIITKKIENDITIVQISDLHSHIYEDNQQFLIEKIEKAQPDIIVLTGDIADDKVPIEGTKLLLSKLMDKYPMFYVTGNHEYWAKNTNEILDIISSYGVIILDGKSITYKKDSDQLIISGVNDPDCELYENEPYEEMFLQSIDNEFFHILLAHRPERVNDYNKYPIDLVLSGHAHGGQFAIPFLINGLIAPNQGLFPAYAGGLYEFDDMLMIVSRGLAINKVVPRFYNKPEVVVIKLIGEVK